MNKVFIVNHAIASSKVSCFANSSAFSWIERGTWKELLDYFQPVSNDTLHQKHVA